MRRWLVSVAAGASALAGLMLAGAISASPEAKATLRVTVSGSGTVTSAPRGISCPRACTKAFTKGSAVKLAAKAKPGALFKRWTGACAAVKTAKCTVRMTAVKRAGAVFVARPPPAFTPQYLAGTWSGRWDDERFGTSGSITVVVSVVDPTTFTLSVTLGGPVAGCVPPRPSLAATITPGTGVNQWNAKGFSAQVADPPAGAAAIAFDFTTKKLTGNGNPGCRPGLRWTMDATQSGNTISGRLNVTLEDGSPVPTRFTMTRT